MVGYKIFFFYKFLENKQYICLQKMYNFIVKIESTLSDFLNIGSMFCASYRMHWFETTMIKKSIMPSSNIALFKLWFLYAGF